MPASFHSKALQKHAGEIEKLAEKLRALYDVRDTSGVGYVAGEWNRLFDAGRSEGSTQEREALKQDYLWYLTLDRCQQEYRQQLHGFLERLRHERAREFARTSFAHRAREDALGKLELALSEASGTINLAMPEHVRREGQGAVTIQWRGAQGTEAELSWYPDGERIDLREALSSGLRHSARLDPADVSFFTDHLIDEIRNVHELELPEFHYEQGLRSRQPPSRLLWTRSTTTPARPAELPESLAQGTRAPQALELELALGGADPELAELIDRVLCAAAAEDYAASEKLTPAERARRAAAVEELVTAVARRAGIPDREVVRLFAPVLVDHPSSAGGPAECAANARALQFLLTQLTEP